jgi:hypothetical protein
MRQRQPDRGWSPLPDAPHGGLGLRADRQRSACLPGSQASGHSASRVHVLFGELASTGYPAYEDRDPWGKFTGRGGRCTSDPTNLYCGVGRDLGVFVREPWDSLEHLIAMNTPRPADGVIRSWVDGKLAYEKKNMVLRIPGHGNLHVRTAWLNMYKGGVHGNCVDSDVWLDQMVLATDSSLVPSGATQLSRHSGCPEWLRDALPPLSQRDARLAFDATKAPYTASSSLVPLIV